MLKRKEAASQPEDFTEGTFRPVIGDDVVDADEGRTRCCSARAAITWDLMVEREKREGDEPATAIARLEQLYPRPVEELLAELEQFPNLKRDPLGAGRAGQHGPVAALRAQPARRSCDGRTIEPVSRRGVDLPSVGQRQAGTRRSRRTCSPGLRPLTGRRHDY